LQVGKLWGSLGKGVDTAGNAACRKYDDEKTSHDHFTLSVSETVDLAIPDETA